MSDELARLRNRVEQLEAKLERTDSQFQRLVNALSRSVDANNRSLTGMMGYTAQLGERVQLIEDDLNGVDEEMAKEAKRRLDDPNAKHVPFVVCEAGVDEEVEREAVERLEDPNAKSVPFTMHVAGIEEKNGGEE